MSRAASEPLASAVVIGASVGAVQALEAILPKLPETFPQPLVIVVHQPREATNGLAALFASRCRIAVKEAEDKEMLRPGTAHFAPADYHLLVEADRRLSLSSDEPELYSRPSIDVLFAAAADAFGTGLTGIVLTGANADGTRGLAAVLAAGGEAWVQTPATAEAGTMPRSALAACPAAKAMTLDEIAASLTGRRA
jgi:two-component system chemotaxis response regulator CheB